MAFSGFYAADGSMNVTVVSGLAETGLYAADGSINVIVPTGGGFKGAYHSCGALYVTVPSVASTAIKAPDGSLYVTTTPFTNGGKHVTVVSGSLSPSTGPSTNWFFLMLGNS